MFTIETGMHIECANGSIHGPMSRAGFDMWKSKCCSKLWYNDLTGVPIGGTEADIVVRTYQVAEFDKDGCQALDFKEGDGKLAVLKLDTIGTQIIVGKLRTWGKAAVIGVEGTRMRWYTKNGRLTTSLNSTVGDIDYVLVPAPLIKVNTKRRINESYGKVGVQPVPIILWEGDSISGEGLDTLYPERYFADMVKTIEKSVANKSFKEWAEKLRTMSTNDSDERSIQWMGESTTPSKALRKLMKEICARNGLTLGEYVWQNHKTIKFEGLNAFGDRKEWFALNVDNGRGSPLPRKI